MDIDRLFDIITVVAWIVFGLLVLFLFLRALRKSGLQDAFRSLYSFPVLVLLFVAVIVTLISASLVFILPEKVGVVISVFAPRGIRDQPLRSGLHFIAPLAERVVIYPIYWQTYTMSGKPLEGEKVGDDSITARTSDGQEVAMDCSIIFRIDHEQVVRVHIDWQERYIEDLIRPVTRGLIRTEVSQYKVNEVNSSKRRDLESDLDRQLRTVLEDKGLILDSFVLRNIAFSPEYASAVEQKQVALEGTTRSIYEAESIRTLALGEADAIKTKAQAEADARRIRAQAESDALKLIAEALAHNSDLLTYQYIDKLAPNIKVMLVPNNAPLILPLPSLETTGTVTAPTLTATPVPPTPTPAPTPTPP